MGKKRYEILLMKTTESGLVAVDFYDDGHTSEKEARKAAISASKRCPFKVAGETIDAVQMTCLEAVLRPDNGCKEAHETGFVCLWREFYAKGRFVAKMSDFGAKMEDGL